MDELVNALANADVEQKIALLPQLLQQGETGIDYFISCLSDRELKVRAKAYQLLQNISSQKVQQAIAPGLLFNSGDKVYSVYQSGMWFTDSSYLLIDEKCLDYFDDLRHQIYGEREDEIGGCRRIYCYLEKELAEEKAEALHRENLQKHSDVFGIEWGFGWCKENPEFDAKKWCSEQNVPYPKNQYGNINFDECLAVGEIEKFIREIGDKSLAGL